jgi:hypothetical protein
MVDHKRLSNLKIEVYLKFNGNDGVIGRGQDAVA